MANVILTVDLSMNLPNYRTLAEQTFETSSLDYVTTMHVFYLIMRYIYICMRHIWGSVPARMLVNVDGRTAFSIYGTMDSIRDHWREAKVVIARYIVKSGE